MTLPTNCYIEISFTNNTGGNYYSIEEAIQSIAMNLTGEACGVHGGPATVESAYIIDEQKKDQQGNFLAQQLWLDCNVVGDVIHVSLKMSR